MKKPVRLAILGSGSMAGVHAKSFHTIPHCQLVAAADVDMDRARHFAKQHDIPHAYHGVDALLREGDFDAVTIVAPDPFHAPLAIQCLKAGKHVLCEKPLATQYSDALRMVKAAQRAGTIHMVNFTYRNWPAIQAVAKLVQKGTLGEIRHVDASYLQSWLASTSWGNWRTDPRFLWRLSSKHGSKGVLGDVGVHIVDFATFPAGPIASVFCQLKAFPKAPKNRVGEYILDANDSAVLNVTFQNGALGTIHATRWATGHPNRLFLEISGTKGAVKIDSEISTDSYQICKGKNIETNTWETVKARPVLTNYARFIRAVRSGKQDQPDFARGAAVQKVLDACFASDAEKRPVKV